MALHLKSLELERIAIQSRGKQSELGVSQKYYSYKDYTDYEHKYCIYLRISEGKAPMNCKHFCC